VRGDTDDLTREVAWEQGVKFQSLENNGRKKPDLFKNHIHSQKKIIPHESMKIVYILNKL
jgi:hypothetical protein